ncbi:hypothetical protein JTB14_004224 [Gonioctena quinquepunctata]|nr:hypothetical protein JTB14_004224 [Gonioctena quinquepunctata]
MDKAIENLGITILCILIMIKLYIFQKQKIKNIFAFVLDIEEQLTNMESENLEVYTLNAVHNKYMNIFLFIHSSLCGLTLVLTKFLAYIQLRNTAIRENSNVTNIDLPVPYIVWRPIDEKKILLSCFFA